MEATHDSERPNDGSPSVDDLWDMLDSGIADTDCPHGCQVEPDGVCPHGHKSVFLKMGLI